MGILRKIKKPCTASIITLVAVFVIFSSANADIIGITPDSEEGYWINDTSNWDAAQFETKLLELNITTGPLTELYKYNVDNEEEGSFKESYTTLFSNSDSDPEDATITWDQGPSFIGTNYNSLWLLVKDGAQGKYAFNLRNLTQYTLDNVSTTTVYSWNGKDILSLTDFWAGDGPLGTGSISHVSIFGGGAPVPEPATMLLFGTGILGLAASVRRRRKDQ